MNTNIITDEFSTMSIEEIEALYDVADLIDVCERFENIFRLPSSLKDEEIATKVGKQIYTLINKVDDVIDII